MNVKLKLARLVVDGDDPINELLLLSLLRLQALRESPPLLESLCFDGDENERRGEEKSRRASKNLLLMLFFSERRSATTEGDGKL